MSRAPLRAMGCTPVRGGYACCGLLCGLQLLAVMYDEQCYSVWPLVVVCMSSLAQLEQRTQFFPSRSIR